MGITHADLFRLLPLALNGANFTVVGKKILVSDDSERSVTICFSAERERRLGSLTLPVTLLEFRFAGYGDNEKDLFMARFDRTFQRGGG